MPGVKLVLEEDSYFCIQVIVLDRCIISSIKLKYDIYHLVCIKFIKSNCYRNKDENQWSNLDLIVEIIRRSHNK